MARNPNLAVVGDSVTFRQNHKELCGKVTSIKKRRAVVLCEGKGWSFKTQKNVHDLFPTRLEDVATCWDLFPPQPENAAT